VESTLDLSVEETYKKVFHKEDMKPFDHLRIGFLEEVVKGEVDIAGEEISVKRAIHVANEEQQKRYKAVDVMRDWYLKSENSPGIGSMDKITEYLREADITYFDEVLTESMEVLHQHRLSYLLKTLEDDIDKKRPDKEIRKSAQRLIIIPEIEDGVFRIIKNYNTALKDEFDASLETGTGIEETAKMLIQTTDPELAQYVQKKLAGYKEKDEQNRKIKYSILDGEVVSETSQEITGKNLLGWVLLGALTAAAVFGIWYLNRTPDKKPETQQERNINAK